MGIAVADLRHAAKLPQLVGVARSEPLALLETAKRLTDLTEKKDVYVRLCDEKGKAIPAAPPVAAQAPARRGGRGRPDACAGRRPRLARPELQAGTLGDALPGLLA
jgi:hypothetical protein